MFRGNVSLKIEKMGGHDLFGKPSVSSTIINTRCSIVKLANERLRTSVRTDTSATGGNAHEIVADARLLVNLSADIGEGDKLTVAGVTLRVDQIFVRNDVNGRGHHHQVDCSIWA